MRASSLLSGPISVYRVAAIRGGREGEREEEEEEPVHLGRVLQRRCAQYSAASPWTQRYRALAPLTCWGGQTERMS